MNNNPITVFVLIPNTCVKKIKMDPTLKFSTFQRLFTSSGKRQFIYNGELVDQTKTLVNYDFKDGNTIVAVPYEESNGLSSDIQTWLTITKDSEFFNDKVQDYIKMDPLQLAQIKDRIQHRRTKNPISQVLRENNLKAEAGFNLQIPSENGPNQVPLPLF